MRREGWEWEEPCRASRVELARSRALLLPGGFALPTVWIYPDQTCRGRSRLYLKSHYGPSAFHHPADALCCSITPCSSRDCRGSLPARWEGQSAAGLPPAPPLVHPHGAKPAGMTPQPFSGLNHQTRHQQRGFLASRGMLCRCWEMGMQGRISSCSGSARTALLSLPRVHFQRCVQRCSSQRATDPGLSKQERLGKPRVIVPM